MRALRMCFVAGLLLAGNLGCRKALRFRLTNWTRDKSIPTNAVCMVLVDEDGNRVAGGVVGHGTEGWDAGLEDLAASAARLHGVPIEISPDAEGVLYFHSPSLPPVLVSGADGTITVPASNLFGFGFIPNWQSNRYEVLSVVHPTRRIGASVSLLPTDLGSRCTVTLNPLRVVAGNIADTDGSPLTNVQSALRTPLWSSVAGYQSTSGRYAYLVPPCTYELVVIMPYRKSFQPFQLTVSPSGSALQKDIRLRKAKPLQTEPMVGGDEANPPPHH